MTRRTRPQLYMLIAVVGARKGHKKAKTQAFHPRCRVQLRLRSAPAKGSPWRMRQRGTNVASLKGYWAGCAEWWSRRLQRARESDSSEPEQATAGGKWLKSTERGCKLVRHAARCGGPRCSCVLIWMMHIDILHACTEYGGRAAPCMINKAAAA